MNGWLQNLSVTEHDETSVVAIICAKDFPEPDTIRNVICSAPGDVVFLIRDRDTVARAAFDDLGCPYVTAPLNPYYKSTTLRPEWEPHPSGEMRLRFVEEPAGDHRAQVRDEEILRLSRRVIVFTTPSTRTLDPYVKASDPDPWKGKVRVISVGKQPVKKHRKGRNME